MQEDTPKRRIDWTGDETARARFFKRSITGSLIGIGIILLVATFLPV